MKALQNFAIIPAMENPDVQRSGCRLKAVNGTDGKPVIRVELFHQTVPLLAGTTVEFELLAGTTMAQARTLVDAANDRILNVVVRK